MTIINCSLIEVDNDHRAVISLPKKHGGDIVKTKPIDRIDYENKTFHAAGRTYDFSR